MAEMSFEKAATEIGKLVSGDMMDAQSKIYAQIRKEQGAKKTDDEVREFWGQLPNAEKVKLTKRAMA